MKQILIGIILILSFNVNAQVEDVPQIDSLKDLYIDMMHEWSTSALDYEMDIRWIGFQIHQWENGKWERHEYWVEEIYDDQYVHSNIVLGLKDTTIFVAQPINFEEFMKWRIKQALK